MAFAPGRLAAALEECLVALDRPATGLCIALSGGLDSTVLLAAVARLRGSGLSLPVRAVHVDHGLHPDSALWSRHCASLAAALDIPIEQLTVDARAQAGESPEAVARKARYAALASRLRSDEVLLTAHHADDQLETVLLQWLRGGGLRAVAGIPAMARFASGWLARPLLGFTRAELRAWAVSEHLEWLEDPSNLDPRFDRNFLRLEVLPVLHRRWPAAARTVGRVAAQAAETLELEADLATADLASVVEGHALSFERLQALPLARRRWVVRAWLRELQLPVPSAATLAALLHDVQASASDRVPCVNWPGARVYRYRGRLYGVTDIGADTGVPEGDWLPGTTYDLGGLGRLLLHPATGTGLSRERLPVPLRVTARVAGETFRPAGSAHHRPLRKWLQEHGVLPWYRQQIPLLVARGEIVAIGDLAYGDTLAAKPGEPSWVVEWEGRPAIGETEAREVKRGA